MNNKFENPKGSEAENTAVNEDKQNVQPKEVKEEEAQKKVSF